MVTEDIALLGFLLFNLHFKYSDVYIRSELMSGWLVVVSALTFSVLWKENKTRQEHYFSSHQFTEAKRI